MGKGESPVQEPFKLRLDNALNHITYIGNNPMLGDGLTRNDLNGNFHC